MNQLQQFQFESNEIRVHVDETGSPWWVVADICRALGISNHRDAASRLPEDWRGVGKTDTPSGPQHMVTCSEPGLYQLIFRSNKPEAQRFREWVFEEVLPAIRETGTYTHPAAGNLGVLTDVSRKLAGVATDHEHRISRLERRVERPLLPADLNVDEVRKRFAGALRDAIRDSGDTEGMSKNASAAYHHGINSKLKNVACNAKRENWDLAKFRLAVDYLLVVYGYDIRWIFGSSMEAA